MEESGLLKPNPLTSHPLSGDANPSKAREEGEVTSSEEDAIPACSNAPSMSASESARPSKSTSSSGGKSSMQGVKSGKSIYASQSGSTDIQSRTSLQISTLKGLTKQRGQLKSSNPQWHKPHGGNSNLVISFSDDDSGSDTEKQQELRKACETDNNSQDLHAITRSKQPSSLLPIMDTIRKTTSNEGKMLPKKVTMSQALAPSMPRSNIPKPRTMSPSIDEQRARSRSSNLVTRNLAIRGSGRSKSVDLSDNKLQDLRQQIALRETELKLKTARQNKENLLEPCRDLNSINQRNPAPRRFRDISSDADLESDAKRKRLCSDGSIQLSKGPHEKTSAKYLLPTKELALKMSNLQDASIVDRVHHDGLAQTEIAQGSIRMQIADEHMPPLLANRNASGQDGPGFSASCSLSDWMSKSRSNLVVSNPKPSVADDSLLNVPKPSGAERAKQSGRVSGSDPSSSRKQATPLDGTSNYNNQQDVQGKTDRFICDGDLQVHAVQAPRNDASTSNHNHKVTIQGFGDADIQSLFALEENHDKQLEEAQEHRHKCEIEERSALKAYLKAQRSLAEANAQCTYLYRKREMLSAHLCSILMENPSLFLPSQQQEQFGDLWNFSNTISEVNLDLIPSASDQIHAEGNQTDYDSNVQSVDGDVPQRFSPNVDGNNLGSEACSEPGASTSELLPHKNKEVANGVLSPSNDLNVSSDECEEMYAIEGKKDDSTTRHPVDSSRESIILEAYLRSKLFSRLETLTSSRRNGIGGKRDEGVEQLPDADTRSGTEMTLDNLPSPRPEQEQLCRPGSASGDQLEVSAEGHTKEDEGNAKAQLRMDNGLQSDVTENQSPPGLRGFEEVERNLSILQEDEEHSLSSSLDRSHKTDNLEDSRPHSTDDGQYLLLSSICRSAFYHVKGAYSASSNDAFLFNQPDDICHSYNDRRFKYIEDSVKDSLVGAIESYSCTSLIDPLLPLCMYDLRGRCNNEECPLQHVRDYSKSSLQYKTPGSADSVTDSSPNCSNRKVREPSHILTPPAYVVCVDNLKADSHTHSYILDRKCGLPWRKIFSISLVAPSFLQSHLPSLEPVLHGSYGCNETRGNPNRQSLYFQSGNDMMNTDLSDKNKVLESALLILNQEIDKAVGIKKALALLSRGLEADPTSLHLWAVYLLTYYSKGNIVDDGEMFSCAVKNNGGSYELWLMYIKSRRRLKDQVSAYARALSTLCHYSFVEDAMHASACILDLLLQMIHSFCMSGNVEAVIKRICRLTDGVKDPDSVLPLDSLQYLGVSDKCVLCVCYAYLVIYKKLPDVIVGMFEFEKDISLIDWPCVHEPLEEKQVVCKLMEMAADSLKSQLDSSVGPGKKTALRAAHLYALNHVKLVAAVDSFENCRDILEKYGNQYSSCLEIVLLAARIRSQKGEGNNFLGFEEALSNWPKEAPGIQCIWNQFAEYALQNGGSHLGKEIMLRWHDFVSKAQCSLNRVAIGDCNDVNNMEVLIELFSSNASELSKLGNMDSVYGLLNLSLFALLQNDVESAYLAADKAMKVAHADFRHCIREHAMFLLNYGSQVGKDLSSLAGLIDILKGYLFHMNNHSVSEPLTRKFIEKIPKPRLRQLVIDTLCPISSDFFTVNSVLETWFGPSLLPQKFKKMKELVDFVEAILELSPCNYPFAISTCKLLQSKEVDAASTSFWASSLLVNTIYQSVPVPPEYVWVEVAELLNELTATETIISESFHNRALSVYPFSMNLWKSFLRQSVSADSKRSVVEAAKEKGIELPITSLEDKGIETAKEMEIEID